MFLSPGLRKLGLVYYCVSAIDQIESLPIEEQNKVIDFVGHLRLKQFEEEQVKIAVQRLDDLDSGLDEEVSHEEAMKLLRQG